MWPDKFQTAKQIFSIAAQVTFETKKKQNQNQFSRLGVTML